MPAVHALRPGKIFNALAQAIQKAVRCLSVSTVLRQAAYTTLTW
jgi:hypothetical protein